MRTIIIIVFVLIAGCTFGQTKVSVDSSGVAFTARDVGLGYTDSCGNQIATKWDKTGWQIKDTMALIRILEHEAQKQAHLHYTAQAAIWLYCGPDSKNWEKFVAALKKYVREWNEYVRSTNKNKR